MTDRNILSWHDTADRGFVEHAVFEETNFKDTVEYVDPRGSSQSSRLSRVRRNVTRWYRLTPVQNHHCHLQS